MQKLVVVAVLVAVSAGSASAWSGMSRYIRPGVVLTAIANGGAYIEDDANPNGPHSLMITDAADECIARVMTVEGPNSLRYLMATRDLINGGLYYATFTPPATAPAP